LIRARVRKLNFIDNQRLLRFDEDRRSTSYTHVISSFLALGPDLPSRFESRLAKMRGMDPRQTMLERCSAVNPGLPSLFLKLRRQ
jgi:hypothetical protein